MLAERVRGLRVQRALAVMLLAACGPGPVRADHGLRFELNELHVAGARADGIVAEIALGTDGGAALGLTAARIEPVPGQVFEDVSVKCRGSFTERELRCEDAVMAAHNAELGEASGEFDLRFRFDSRSLQIENLVVSLGEVRIAGRLSHDGDAWGGELNSSPLALQRLRALMAAQPDWLSAYSDEQGEVALSLRFQGSGEALQSAAGTVSASEVGFYGPNSAENATGRLEFRVERKAGWDVTVGAALERGLLYLEPGMELDGIRPGIVLEAKAGPVTLGTTLHWDGEARRLVINEAEIVHPAVVTASLSGDLQFDEGLRIHAADAAITGAQAGAIYTVYLQPFLLGTRFNAMEAAGALDAAVKIRGGELQDLNVHFHDVHAYDGNNRFFFAGLDGDLRVHDGGVPVRSALRWSGIGVYRLNFGASELLLESSGNDVKVLNWADLPLLDGAVKIDALSVSQAGRRDMRIRLDGSITPISVADLTQALGWPIMSGKLTGTLRGLTYEHGRVTVDGEINVGLFDGSVEISHLRIVDLFDLVPVLTADIDVRGIDLEQLTDRFSFGRIEGRLDGYIHDLELQAWQPVYFEAAVATPEDDDTRHRISQRAVDNLGYLGAGASSALSSGLLRFFEDYSYGRLGIGCRLYNGACEMSGVEDAPDGFMILTRGGLLPPWIEVKGTGRTIQWRTLIEGLKSIAANPVEIR